MNQIFSKPESITPAICRVDKRLRGESLPLYFGCTQFIAKSYHRYSYRHDILSNHWRWILRVGSTNPRFLRRLKYAGMRVTSWVCEMDFKNATLDTQNWDNDYCVIDMSKIRWCMKRAFLHVTKGESWQPTGEGLSLLLQVFPVCFSDDNISARGVSVLEATKKTDLRIPELWRRFPDIYPKNRSIDLSSVMLDKKAIMVEMNGVTKGPRDTFSAQPMYRYVGRVGI